MLEYIDDSYMTGTQYSILLPFITKQEKPYSFLNTDVQFPIPSGSYMLNDKDNNKYISEFTEFLDKYKDLAYNSDLAKRQCIHILSETLSKYKPDDSIITIFDASFLTSQNIEIFAKALIHFIAKNQKEETNIAIKNCPADTFKQLVRTFVMFYDRDGRNEILGKSQMYLSGKSNNNVAPIY